MSEVSQSSDTQMPFDKISNMGMSALTELADLHGLQPARSVFSADSSVA